jgi:hypothetical protein
VLEFGRKRIIVDSITNKKELKMAKQIKSTKTRRGLPRGAKAAVAVGAMGMAAMFGACDNGTNSTSSPKLCECPNGTVHPEGTNMPCCDGDNCECVAIHSYPIQYLGDKEITIEYHVASAVGLLKISENAPYCVQ